MNSDYRKIGNLHCFHMEQNDNGMCFKDLDEYSRRDKTSDRPCYVGEYAFDWRGAGEGEVDGEQFDLILDDDTVIFTYGDLVKEAEDYYNEYKTEFNEMGINSIEELCDQMFSGLEWQYPTTILEEILNG